MRIGIDLDSTLNNLDEAWCKWIAETIRPGATLEQWTDWDVAKCFGSERVWDFLYMRGSFGNLVPRDGAVEVTKRLAEIHELFVVTTSHHKVWEEKAEWLGRHFPHLDRNRFITTSYKGLLNLDVLVDDGLHNFVGDATHPPFAGKCILFDRPWNRSSTFVETFVDNIQKFRVLNWYEADGILNLLERLRRHYTGNTSNAAALN